jgi:hypothetical protein
LQEKIPFIEEILDNLTETVQVHTLPLIIVSAVTTLYLLTPAILNNLTETLTETAQVPSSH